MGACASGPDITAQRQAKVEAMWKAAPKDEKDEMERLKCWAYILGDDELCALYGANAAAGKEVLEAMKAVKALDVSRNGIINQGEFFRLLDPGVINAAEVKAALPKKVAALWAAMPKDDKQQIERLACWAVLLKDDELATLVGKKDKTLGKKMLAAMKEVKALDVSGDGQINQAEFERLMNEEVIASAELRVSLGGKVAALWAAMPKDDKQQIERLACWDILLEDNNLAILLGKNDLGKGKRMLAAMKEVKALDVSGDGQINQAEFERLLDPEVIAAAEAKA